MNVSLLDIMKKDKLINLLLKENNELLQEMAELRFKIRQLKRELKEYEIFVSGVVDDRRTTKNSGR